MPALESAEAIRRSLSLLACGVPEPFHSWQVTQKLQTRLATKLNALVGRAGKQSELTDQLTALGLSAEQCQALFRRASWPH